MNKEDLVQLTIDLYCLTLLFPKKEPLRYKMREVGDNVLEIFARFGPDLEPKLILEVVKDIGVLENFFLIAEKQNWVAAPDVLKVSQKYVNLRQALEDASNKESLEAIAPQEQTALLPLESKKPQVSLSSSAEPSNEARHKRIIEVLKERGKGQVWEFQRLFPTVSKRTLRRDFEYLLSQGLVERVGEANQTFYQPKAVQALSTI